MPRAIWTGAIAFGLVNVPIRVYSATHSEDVRFHQFEEGTGKRIDYRRFAEGTDREVEYGDIVRGYELAAGRYVMLTSEEMESVEPGRSRTIDIEDFVSLPEIDPVYFERSYYLEPAEGGERPYALLRETMRTTDRVGIGRFVMRSKQYLAAIRPREDVLVLETMFFGDEVRRPADLALPDRDGVDLSDRELGIAEQLIESLTVPFDPARYADTYRDRVLDLIRRKAEGEAVTVTAPEEPAPVVGLMAALEASLRGARGNGHAAGGGEALDALTRDQLYERAKEADIPGRSSMSKDDLVEALREAS